METSELFTHGIQTENSDIRAHVGVLAKAVYVFRTPEGLRAIEKYNPPLAPAFQDGVTGKTAMGWKVKLEWINDVRVCHLAHWKVWEGWTQNLSTSEKGRRAVAIVCHMLKRAVFPLWLEGCDDDRETVQIKGTDIVVFARKKIQVKCDYRAGFGVGCTGNVYLQCEERNPLKRI